MRVVIVKMSNQFPNVGVALDLDDEVAAGLIARGIAQRADESTAVETATVESIETADAADVTEREAPEPDPEEAEEEASE